MKRKRAQAQVNKETAYTTEEPTKGNQQPDLGDLSKDLPLGWQVISSRVAKPVTTYIYLFLVLRSPRHRKQQNGMQRKYTVQQHISITFEPTESSF